MGEDNRSRTIWRRYKFKRSLWSHLVSIQLICTPNLNLNFNLNLDLISKNNQHTFYIWKILISWFMGLNANDCHQPPTHTQAKIHHQSRRHFICHKLSDELSSNWNVIIIRRRSKCEITFIIKNSLDSSSFYSSSSSSYKHTAQQQLHNNNILKTLEMKMMWRIDLNLKTRQYQRLSHTQTQPLTHSHALEKNT